jgi:purine-binding chemotaxis protein CheW
MNLNESGPNTVLPAGTTSTQILTFTLGAEEYGLDILDVQEIKGLTAISGIPNTPAHVRGVINMRGTIVPIVALRTRFGMPPADTTPFSVIIVVRVEGRTTGLLVDGVSDVLTLRPEDVDLPPELGRDVDLRFVRGIARASGRLVTLLDVPRVLELGENDAPAEDS